MTDRPKARSGEGSTTRLAPRPGAVREVTGCRLRVLSGPDAGRTLTIEGRAIRIGKGSECDLKLSDLAVSRAHVMISPCPGGFLIEDLGSTNGTKVNGAVVSCAAVDRACRIELGTTVIECVPQARQLRIAQTGDTALEGLLGASPAMGFVYGLIRHVAPTEATVVITGETGTGKECAARAIHALSQRKDGPFEIVDCGNVDRELLGSELFGHEKGAFTGAVASRKGAFDRARGGTIFLDEVGELPPDVQTRLLGVLQRREIRALGADAAHPVDTRIVAATHRDLARLIEAGTFREDLYFRLAVITLEMPPLRERPEDIPQLVDAFVKELGPAGAAPVTSAALEYFATQPWKGNVRELKNAVHRAVVMARGQPIDVAHIVPPRRPGKLPPLPPTATLDQIEARAVEAAYALHKGNKMRTARALGISVVTLKKKLRDYGIGDPERN